MGAITYSSSASTTSSPTSSTAGTSICSVISSTAGTTIYSSTIASSSPNHNLWDVIVNGDLEEEPAPTTGETSAPPAPKTAKQLAARRNQERVKSILLLAIPDEYRLKFYNVVDAKSLWEAIKSRFGALLLLHNQQPVLNLRKRIFTDGLEMTGGTGSFDGSVYVDVKSKRSQGRRSYVDNGRSNAPTNESSSQALVAQDGLGGYDWSNDFEVEPVNYALMAISSSSSSSSSDSEVQKCSKCLESFKCLQKNYDTEREKHNKAKLEIRGYEIALESLESRIIGHEKNELAWGEKYEFQNYELKCREIKINNLNLELEKAVKERDELKDKIAKWEESTKNLEEILKSQMSARDKIGLDEYAIRNKIIELQTTKLNNKTSETAGKTNDANTKKPKSISESVVSNPKINRDSVIIEDWTSDDVEEVSGVQKVRPENQTVKTRDDKSGQNSHKQRVGFRKVKVCFVCRSTEYLIKDCVSSRTGLHRLSINTARSVCTARPSINTARPVSTVRPSISTARPIYTARSSIRTVRPVYASRSIYPRMDNVRPKAHVHLSRAVVNTGKGKLDTDLKKSRWVWRPKRNYLDHVSKDSGSFKLKKGNLEILLQDHAVVDSGCSSHMTGNKAYLSENEDFNRGFVAFGSDPKGGKTTGKGKIKTANLDFDDVYFVDELKFNLFSVSQMCDKKNSILFTEFEYLILSPSFKLLDEGQVVLRAPRKDNVYSLDLKNIIPSGGITCLYANATADESKLWHRRLGHVNFKNINKLVKGHLVRGLPSKVFVNDHMCVACKKGKQHKASCKAKLDRIIRKPLELLHMNLFGPVSVESINKKRYCLVVTDDFSRFSWVFFLATKDETSKILYNLIIGLEKQLNHNVKIIRCDNGTEFKNHAMNEL
ncbi:putative ribonuclease H-like domain-containing protein [Tanacetum coccineum]